MCELPRIRVKSIETFARAESIFASADYFRVSATRRDVHSAYWIFLSASSGLTVIKMMVPVNHVRAAAPAHHHIEERRE